MTVTLDEGHSNSYGLKRPIVHSFMTEVAIVSEKMPIFKVFKILHYLLWAVTLVSQGRDLGRSLNVVWSEAFCHDVAMCRKDK